MLEPCPLQWSDLPPSPPQKKVIFFSCSSSKNGVNSQSGIFLISLAFWFFACVRVCLCVRGRNKGVIAYVLNFALFFGGEWACHGWHSGACS